MSRRSACAAADRARQNGAELLRLRLLEYLSEHPGRHQVRPLATALGVSAHSVWTRLQELAEAGDVLIHRTRNGRGRIWAELA